jgi:Intraflagellar transport complex B protein 46 C terminal
VCLLIAVCLQFKPKGHFPPIDTLMQTWPEDLEPLIRGLRKPDGDVDIDMMTLVRTVCGLLDIPVYDDSIDSLHWVFMLFLEMKNNEMINHPEEQAIGTTNQLNFVSLA